MLTINLAYWLQWLVGSVRIREPVSPLSSPASWEQYVQAPNSHIVYPISIIPSYTTGNVSNPSGLLSAGGGVTTFTRASPRATRRWPVGTIAESPGYYASSPSAGHLCDSHPRNAVDGDITTSWIDDSSGSYPHILTLVAPHAIDIPGVTIVSSGESVAVNWTVEVLQSDGSWLLAGGPKSCNDTMVQIPFVSSIRALGVRISGIRDHNTYPWRKFRISEVWPGLVTDLPLSPSVVLDFGKPVVGFLSISFAGASMNRPGIRLAFSEMTEYLTDVSDFSRSYNGDTITPGSDQIAVLPKPYIWNDDHGCANGTKICADGLHGFRYVKIYLDALESDAPDVQPYGSVSIDAVYLNFTAYLGTPDTFTGWFECSDETLNQFWYNASYTNEMCIDTFRVNDTEPRNAASPSLIGKLVIHDAPKRDRDPYVGDIAVAGRTLYLTHNASVAARNVLADLADHQRSDGWIPPASLGNYGLALFDYPLWWVVTTCDLLLYTEDDKFFVDYYHTMVKVLDEYYPSTTDNTTGLVSKGLGGSGGYGDYAFLPRTGVITYYNALYVLALRNAANIAHFYKKNNDASRWNDRALLVSRAVNEHLWDPYVGAYVDTVNSTTHGQDGNMIAILAGIVSPNRTQSILLYWSSLALFYGNPFFSNDHLASGFSTRVYPFISYFEIAARFETVGMEDSAIEEIKRLYGWMSSQDPGTTFWEGIGAQGGKYEGGYTSAAHGWSTGVLPILSNYVLGVMPTAPGFTRWTLKPVPAGGLSWAKGQVPTPKGPFKVSWSVQGIPAVLQMEIEVPQGTDGEVAIPLGLSSTGVVVNGVVIWQNGKPLQLGAQYRDGHVRFDLSEGKYKIRVAERNSPWSRLQSSKCTCPDSICKAAFNTQLYGTIEANHQECSVPQV